MKKKYISFILISQKTNKQTKKQINKQTNKKQKNKTNQDKTKQGTQTNEGKVEKIRTGPSTLN